MEGTVSLSTEEYWKLRTAYDTLMSTENCVYVETNIRTGGSLVYSIRETELISKMKEENDRLSKALIKCYDSKAPTPPIKKKKKWYQIWK